MADSNSAPFYRSNTFNNNESRIGFLTGSLDLNHRIIQINIGETNGLSRDLLSHVHEAIYRYSDTDENRICHEGTRDAVLRKIHGWLDGQDHHQPFFWLSGWAGTGKSTIARTVAKTRRCANFFFARGKGADRAGTKKFVTTLAYQLASSSPVVKSSISTRLKGYPDISEKPLEEQWCELIVKPIANLREDDKSLPIILVVDALDECEDGTIDRFLNILRTTNARRLRILVTSRPNVLHRFQMQKEINVQYPCTELHTIDRDIVDRDIFNFMRHSLAELAVNEECLKRLTHKAGGLFEWAATAVRFITGPTKELYTNRLWLAKDRLDMLLESDNRTTDPYAPETKLNEIYLTVLHDSIRGNFSNDHIDLICRGIRHVLGCIVTMFSELPPFWLYKLISNGLENDRISVVDLHEELRNLSAIIDAPERKNEQHTRLRIHHPSLRDFLLDPNRCTDERFSIDEAKAHETLLECCIRVLRKRLKQDIFSLRAPGINVEEARKIYHQLWFDPDLEYSCLYWIGHSEKGRTQLHDDGAVHQFLKEHVLHWLEALSWMGKISQGLESLTSLSRNSIVANQSPRLRDFVEDIATFTKHNQPILSQSPLQIYFGALLFTPQSNLVRESSGQGWSRLLRYLPGNVEEWGFGLQVLEHHTRTVETVAFARGATILASASKDRTIKVWDPTTNRLLWSFEGGRKRISCMSISSDGKRLALVVLNERFIQVHDLETRQCVNEFECSESVKGIWFEENSQTRELIAVTTGFVQFWNLFTGECLSVPCEGLTLGHSSSIIFSTDGRTIVSWFPGKEIQLWNCTRGGVRAVETLDCGTSQAVAISRNGTLIASASQDIRILNRNTGSPTVCEGHAYPLRITALAFSGDERRLASGSSDIKIWDIDSGQCLITLDGHTSPVTTIAFSGSGKLLASGSEDRTVRLWNLEEDRNSQRREDYTREITAITVTDDGTLAATGSANSEIILWDTGSGKALTTLRGHSGEICDMLFLLGGRLLASGSTDFTARLWDIDAGQWCCKRVLQGHGSAIQSLACSEDGRTLATISLDNTIRLWDVTTGVRRRVLKGHGDNIQKAAFSKGGTMIASASWDSTIRLWEITGDTTPYTLEDHDKWVEDITFTADDTILATCARDNTVRLWDVKTREILQILWHKRAVTRLAVSGDARILVSISEDHTINVWNMQNYKLISKMPGFLVRKISLSSDGRYLHTERGSLALDQDLSGEDASTASSAPHPLFYIDKDWITRGGEKILWIPPDYRSPSCSAVHGKIVVLGYASGQIILLHFS